ALQLLHAEAVGDAVHSRAAVALDRRPEEAHLRDLRHERLRELALFPGIPNDRQELRVDEFADGLTDHPLLIAQERIDLVEIYSAKLFHERFLLGVRPATVS